MDTAAIKTKNSNNKRGQTDNKPFQTFRCLRALVPAGAAVSHSCCRGREGGPGIWTTTSFCSEERVTAKHVIMWHLHRIIPEGAQDVTPLLMQKADKELRSCVEEVGPFKHAHVLGNVPVKAQGTNRKPVRGRECSQTCKDGLINTPLQVVLKPSVCDMQKEL